ncbi:hypothetical protein CBS101457_006605 [Exobasidium rhododendri]|nr:hypothetical protein CBS101457_006605 [Exobasidium rhododendri]
MSTKASTSAAALAASSNAPFGIEAGTGANDEQERDPGLNKAEEDEEEEEEEEEEEGAGAEEIVGDGGAANQYEEDAYESESPSDSGTDSLTWISWFCSLPGHEYFAEVSEDFIEDDFNLTGLNALVPFYKEALEMILDVEPQEDSLKIPDVSIVESSAELLYGLIHQRFILTRQGLQQMVEKYERGHFGFCPRVFCHSHPVLPCGRSDLPGLDTVKLFCANCIDNYSPPSSRFHGVDGAFFGTTFPHLLFQTYRELAPSPIAPIGTNFSSLNTQTSLSKAANNGARVGSVEPAGTDPATTGDAQGATSANVEKKSQASSSTSPKSDVPLIAPTLQQSLLGQRAPQARLYTPRIYGFRVSEHAKNGPRMRWMRMRPESFEELDQGIVTTSATTAAAAAGAAKVTPSKGATGDGAVDVTEAAAAAAEEEDVTMSPSAPGVTADGRSMATGRLIAGRATSASTPAP